MLSAILESNKRQIEQAYRLIKLTGRMRVGVLGLSFKAGTDDVRESPIVALIETLLGKGYKIAIYDEEVSLAKIYGANKRHLEESIPHISCLMKSSVQEVTENSDIVIISKKTEIFNKEVYNLKKNTFVIDLVKILSDLEERPPYYEGICW